MPDVRLVDLEVIRRYSLAVRQESADASELLRVLESDVAELKRSTARKRVSSSRAKPVRKSAATTKRAPRRVTTRRTR